MNFRIPCIIFVLGSSLSHDHLTLSLGVTSHSPLSVSNNVAHLGSPKEGPKPKQLLSLPPIPATPCPLPRKKMGSLRVTAISWVKHHFADIPSPVIQSHFNKGLIQLECSGFNDSPQEKVPQLQHLRKNENGCGAFLWKDEVANWQQPEVNSSTCEQENRREEKSNLITVNKKLESLVRVFIEVEKIRNMYL